MKAIECQYIENKAKLDVISDQKNVVIQNLEQRQMQLSAELVHHKQQKQVLAN